MKNSSLEFHFEYNPHRKNVADILYAMGHYIEAYEAFGNAIANAIGHDLEFSIELEEITSGSIKLKFLKLFDLLTSPNDLMNDLTGSVNSYDELVTITDAHNEKLANKVNASGKFKERIEPTLCELDIALAMDKLSEANRMIEPDEKLTITEDLSIPDNVISIDTGFRLTKRPREMFSNYMGQHDGDEIVNVIRPCFKGHLKWRFQNTNTRLIYNAPIKHAKWLEEYQNGAQNIEVKDSLLVDSTYELWKVKGETCIKNARVNRVKDIIKCSGEQNEFFRRD
ncbi:hypothetical protein GNP89_19450 [Aliivibrio fischeri]|uniref:hypothetical protein n=1 Tax=Aliivibrio fischeri TaxID=668 RepID=UPI0012D85BFB|nr:hypothetical protein [Aliivibrio fischeri]MUL04342.1 hypothetical protein [Aliivibrio fischeri]